MKGVIRGPDYISGRPQPKLSLDVLEGLSGRTLKTFETNEAGEFEVDGIIPGLYFLSLKSSGLNSWAGHPSTGRIAVAVDHNAPANHLDLDLGWTSCGLWYSDRSACPQGDLQVQQLSGQVVDASEASIPSAKVLLFDQAENLVERIQSDSLGEFTSPNSLQGSYHLVVNASGFTPLRARVRLGTGNPSSSLTLQLGLFGSCGSAQAH